MPTYPIGQNATAFSGVVIWTLHLTGVATGALPAVCPAMNLSYNAPRVTVRMT
jgi:hypothetical protein